ncbi:MAG: hypothetical protein AB1746_15535 [Candidatus Zixiibacteriota bacterium]
MAHKNRFFSLVLLASVILASSVFAGGKTGQVGIGLSATDATPTFTLSFWHSNNMKMEPSFAIARLSPDGGDSYTRIMPGLGYFYCLKPGSSIRPYFGARFMLDMSMFDGETYTDYLAAPAFGAEYFFSDNFSVTGEYQVQFIFANDNYSRNLPVGSTAIETAAILGVNFYF